MAFRFVGRRTVQIEEEQQDEKQKTDVVAQRRDKRGVITLAVLRASLCYGPRRHIVPGIRAHRASFCWPVVVCVCVCARYASTCTPARLLSPVCQCFLCSPPLRPTHPQSHTHTVTPRELFTSSAEEVCCYLLMQTPSIFRPGGGGGGGHITPLSTSPEKHLPKETG